jgi:hypothetical protein
MQGCISKEMNRCENFGSDSISSVGETIGHLVPLQTTLETSARDAIVNVYIAAVFPPQKASAALRSNNITLVAERHLAKISWQFG